MARKQGLSADDLFADALANLRQGLDRPNIYGYTPYKEQEEFHRCDKWGRYLAGGNRGGKTDAMVAEMVWIALDEHPWRQRPEAWGHGPLQLRCFVVDVEKGVKQILIPKLKRYIPTSQLIDGDWAKSWDQNALMLTFENGSTIDFLTYGMGLEKMGGVPRHAIFFDEEPPQDIFNESMLRLLDYEGIWVIAATPVEGIGWTFDLLWDFGITEPNNPAAPGCFTLSAAKNPYLKAKSDTFDKYSIGMDEEEKKMRFEGEFVARSGLVFPNFSVQTHVVDPYRYFPDGRPPADWRWYSSVDHGLNNPTAWLWHGVSPQGDIITFAEHYQSNMVIETHAHIVHTREREWGRSPEIRTGDPAMSQRTAVTGTNILQEYALRGIFIGVENVPRDVETGLEKMRSYFRILEHGSYWGPNRPKWVIADVCQNFIREMKKLRWATNDSRKAAYSKNVQEVVHKKDDHAFDSARYFATQMPNLAPAASEPGPMYGVGSRSYAELVAESVANGDWQTEDLSDSDEW